MATASMRRVDPEQSRPDTPERDALPVTTDEPDEDRSEQSRPDDEGLADDETSALIDKLRALLPRTGTDFDFALALVKVLEPVDHLRQYVTPMLEHLVALDARSPVEATDALFTGPFPTPDRRAEIRALVEHGEADLGGC